MRPGDEIRHLRTANGKTFWLGGNTFRLALSLGPVHVPGRRGGWFDPDLRWRGRWFGLNGYRVRRALYAAAAPRRGVSLALRGPKGGNVTVALEAVGGRAPRPVRAKPDGRGIVWAGVAPGVDVTLRADLARCELFKVLRTPDAPRQMAWRIEADAGGMEEFSLLKRSFGKDAAGEPLHLVQEATEPEEVAPGRWRWHVTETFTGRTVRTDPRTRVRSLRGEAETAWPVCVDPTVTLNVAAAADNGEGQTEALTWTNTGSQSSGYYGAMLFAYSSARRFQLGCRFTNATIPQGATVSAATFSTTVRKVSAIGFPVGGFVYGDAADDAAAWSNTSRPDQITKTTAKKAISQATATGAVSYDLAAVVQEIVNRAGWASGNAMRFGWLCTYPAHTSNRSYYGTVGDHYSDVPQLTVTYSVASGAALDDEGVLFAWTTQW